MTVILQRGNRLYDASFRKMAGCRRKWFVELAYLEIGSEAKGFRISRHRSFWRALGRYVWVILHPEYQFARAVRNPNPHRRLRRGGWRSTH